MKNIKFISQYNDIKNEEWKHRGCTLSAAWMALNFLQKDFNLTPDELLNEAIKIKAFDFDSGGWWRHDRICILMHNYGVLAYSEEFKSIPFGIETKYANELNEKGIEKIFDFVKGGGLAIVSIPKNLIEIGKHHSILIHSMRIENQNGKEKRFFIYHDCEKENERQGANLEIEINIFKKVWRKLAIFVG